MTNEYFYTSPRVYEDIDSDSIKSLLKDPQIRKQLLINSSHVIGSPYCQNNETLWQACLEDLTNNQIRTGQTTLFMIPFRSPLSDSSPFDRQTGALIETGVYIQKPSVVKIFPDKGRNFFYVKNSERTTLFYSELIDAIVIGGAPYSIDQSIYFGRLWLAPGYLQGRATEELIRVSDELGRDSKTLIEFQAKLHTQQAWVTQELLNI